MKLLNLCESADAVKNEYTDQHRRGKASDEHIIMLVTNPDYSENSLKTTCQ